MEIVRGGEDDKDCQSGKGYRRKRKVLTRKGEKSLSKLQLHALTNVLVDLAYLFLVENILVRNKVFNMPIIKVRKKSEKKFKE